MSKLEIDESLFITALVNHYQYQKIIKYDWEHPDFDPTDKPFFKQFDENGNFINPPKPEIVEETEVDSYFKSSVKF